MFLSLGFLSVLLLVTRFVDATCPDDAERAANGVELKFYRAQTSSWSSDDNSAKVALQVSRQANAYCGSNPAACGLENCCSSEFKDLNVQVAAGYPQDAKNKKDMKLKIYVDLPSTLNTTGTLQCVLSASTLQDIIGNIRSQIHEDTGSWITWVDETIFYGIPPDHTLNAVMIPIAFIIVLAIIITAVILHFWNKRREAIARRHRIIEERKKKSTAKVAPTYRMETLSKDGAKDQGSDKPRRKDESYKESVRQRNTATSKTGSYHSEDSAIKLDSTPTPQRQRNGYDDRRQRSRSPEPVYRDGATGTGKPSAHLHPIEQYADDSQVDTEKKKKKKKKHKKHRDIEGHENADYSSTGDAYQRNY